MFIRNQIITTIIFILNQIITIMFKLNQILTIFILDYYCLYQIITIMFILNQIITTMFMLLVKETITLLKSSIYTFLRTLQVCKAFKCIVVKSDLDYYWKSPHGIVANVLDCEIKISDFKLQSHYYIHFQTKTFGNCIKSFISSAMG